MSSATQLPFERRLRVFAGAAVLAAIALLCWLAPTAAAQECTNASAICAPGGNFSIQFFHQGEGFCRFDARIDWNDGSVYNSPNFANGFIASHNFTQPNTYNVSVTGSGTPLQEEVICQFVPNSYKVEVPLPPPCDAQAQPPGCIFTIGLNDPVPPEVKDHFREAAQKLTTANGQMGMLTGAACLPTKGLKGIPTQNRGLKIGFSFLSCGGLSGLGIAKGAAVADFYQEIADDPPDPNFSSIPALTVPKVSKLKGGKIKKKAAKRLTDVFRAQAALLANSEALLRGLERAQGAAQAGDLGFQIRQTFAARNFALNLATAFRESAAARAALGKAGGGIQLSKKTVRLLRKIARKTPARKFKGPDGKSIRKAMLKGPVRKVSFPKGLSSKALISAEQEAAASLEQWAAALFPSASNVIVSRAHRGARPPFG